MTASHTTDLDMGSRLSLLWIFYMFNAAYIDITTLYYSVFINHHAKVHYTQAFLLGAGVLIEISISMVVLSRLLRYRVNRRANIAAGAFLTAVQIVTLFVATPTLAYLFFSLILIATSSAAVWYASKWSDPATRTALSGNSPALIAEPERRSKTSPTAHSDLQGVTQLDPGRPSPEPPFSARRAPLRRRRLSSFARNSCTG